MGKLTGILGLLTVFLFLSCGAGGIDINLKCLTKHTAEVVNVESSLLGEKDQVFINLTWVWTLQRPTIDAVIVARSIGDLSHFVQIDTLFSIDSLMTCNDVDSVLEPDMIVYYQLNSLYGAAVEPFETIDVNIPAIQHITQPDSEYISITNDTLTISFSRLADFDTTDIAVYRGGPKSIDSLLNFLTNPLYDTTITDTIIAIPGADSLFPADTLVPYTIRITSSSISGLDLITDTSIGFRAFIRLFKKK